MAKSKERNKNKKAKRKKDGAASQEVNNGVVTAADTAPEGRTPADEGKKKKKYEKRIKVKLAGAVSNFLVLNAVSFRARYDGSGVYTFRVDKDQSSMLDDLCERLKE